MAKSATGGELAQLEQKFGPTDLWRIALWGLAAASALTMAAFASTSAVGIGRLMQAAGQLQAVIGATGNTPPRPFDAREGQRLADAVSLLADDRERLHARIATIEHNVDNMAGSIARMGKLVDAAPPPLPAAVLAQIPSSTSSPIATPSADARPSQTPLSEDSTASVNAAASLQMPQHAPATQEPAAPDPPVKTEFGLDIGGSSTIEGLRALWAKVRQQHTTALEGLRPVVHLRESRRPGGIELRLVAGPLPSAVAAARLCAALGAAGAPCRPAPFDGQRLLAR